MLLDTLTSAEEEEEAESLYHYGVKGMKWGVRRKSKTARNRAKSKKRAEKNRSKKAKKAKKARRKKKRQQFLDKIPDEVKGVAATAFYTTAVSVAFTAADPAVRQTGKNFVNNIIDAGVSKVQSTDTYKEQRGNNPEGSMMVDNWAAKRRNR